MRILLACLLTIVIPHHALGEKQGGASAPQQRVQDAAPPTPAPEKAPAPGPEQQNSRCGTPPLLTNPEFWLAILAVPSLYVLWLQSKANGVAAEAARVSAVAAQNSASALINSERAWIMVDVRLKKQLGISHGTNSSHADIEIDVRNAGRTPAWIHERLVQMSILVDPPPVPQFGDQAKTIDGVFPVGPNEPAPTANAFLSAQGQRAEWPNKDIHLYIWGVVRYRDSFGQSRETYFGYIVRGNNQLERLPQEAYNKQT
jgi:hypothetical protein